MPWLRVLVLVLSLAFIGTSFGAYTTNQFLTGNTSTNNFTSVTVGPGNVFYGAWKSNEPSPSTVHFVKIATWNGTSWVEVPGASFTNADTTGPLGLSQINNIQPKSLAVDTSGNIHIVFAVSNPNVEGARGLAYGKFTASTSTWAFRKIFIVQSVTNGFLNVGDYCMALDASQNPHIVFDWSDAHDDPDREARLIHAFFNGTAWNVTGNTNQKDGFQIDMSDGSNQEGVSSPDLVLDSAGNFHLCYSKEDTDQVSGDCWYVKRTGSTWGTPAEVADLNNFIQGSIVVDSSNNVHIGSRFVGAASANPVTYRITTNASGSWVTSNVSTFTVPGAATVNSNDVIMRINSLGRRVMVNTVRGNTQISNHVRVIYETSPGTWTQEEARTDAGTLNYNFPSMALRSDGTIMALFHRQVVSTERNVYFATGIPTGFQPVATAPTVTTPTSTAVTGTTATLGGNATADGGAAITARGVVYSRTSLNSNPQIGGANVTNATTSGTTGVFTVNVSSLLPGTQYSFAAYATNSVGTTYTSPASTFTTLSNVSSLSALTFSAGTISPAFAAGTTSYSFSVPNGTTGTTVTATRTQGNATLQVQSNGGGFGALTSGSPSGNLALGVGPNTVDVRVTAQDGTTTTTYTTTITRAAPSTTVTSLNRANATPTNAATVNWTLTLGSATTGVAASHFSLSGTASSGASVGTPTTGNGGLTWNVPVTTGSGSGTLTLTMANATGTSQAVSNVPFGGETYTMDKTVPTVAMNSAAANPTNVSPIPVTVTFSESVTGFVAGDITAGNGTVNNFAGSGTTYTFDLVPSGQGLVTANIAGGVAQDGVGNGNTAAAQFSRTYDSVAPTVAMNSAAANPTGTSPIPVTVTFSESVTGFVAGDITAGNGTVSNFTGSGASYSFNLVPSGSGSVTANIGAGIAQDAAGNGNTAAAQFSRTYSPAPTFDITLSFSGGTLNIDASGSTGSANVTLRFVTGPGGPFLEVVDSSRSLGAGPGMTQVNPNTVRIPIASITAINLTGGSQADSFTLDFSAGDICPAGGISVNGGAPVTPPGDSMIVDGDFSSGGVYGTGGPGAGVLTLDSGNVVTFTGLEPLDLSGATFPNFTVQVDPGSVFPGNVITTVTAVDGGVNTLVSFTGGLESVKLGTVTNTLSIQGDNVDNDYFELRGIGTAMAGDFVVDGQGGNADVIDIYNGTLALAAGKNISLKADHLALGMDAAGTGVGAINVSGNITLEADGDNSITSPPLWGSGGVWGATVPTYFSPSALFTQRGSIQMRGLISKTAGGDATATLRARAGVGFMNVAVNAGMITSSSNKLHVVVHADSDANNDGSVQMQNVAAITTNGGDVIIGGGVDPATGPAVGVAGGGATAGVLINNAAINTAGGNVSIRGRGFAGNSGLGVLVQASGAADGNPVLNTGSGSITLVGTGGGTTGSVSTCHGISFNGLAAKPVQLLTTTGTVSLTGTATTGNNNGLLLQNQLDISASDAGAVDLTASGFGNGIGLGVTAGAGTTARVKSVGGNLVFTSDTMSVETGAGSRTFETSGAGTITLKQRTNGQSIGIGAADALAELGISNVELGFFTTPTLIVGDANTGALTVKQVVAPAAFHTLALGKSASFTSTGGLALDISSATVYEKVTVNGDLTIDPAATLSVNPGVFVPAAGDSFLLMANSGANPVVGTFAGLPEGTLMNVGGVDKKLTYVGGTGNDIVLAAPVFAPTVTSTGASAVTPLGATLNGEITSDGAAAITERGFVYAPTATDSDPNIGDLGVIKVIEGGTAVGIFTQPVTGLTPNTGYSFKAYAINAQGTGYSAVQTFTTAPPGAPAVNDGVITGTGPAVLFPLANDPANNTTIIGVSNPAITISADGRSLIVPPNFTGSFTYTTSAGTTATVDVIAGTPVVAPRKYTGLLYDNTGAMAGWASASVSPRGSASAQVRVGAATGRGVFSFKATASSTTGSTTLGAITLTRNADGTLGAELAATGGTLTGALSPTPLTFTALKYHVALASIDPGIPGGGHLRATVTSRGQVRMVATMPDGRPFTVGTGITDNGTIIFYGKQSSGVDPNAVVGGQLVPADLARTDVTGEILWLKPAQAPGAKGQHLGGVDTLLVANGSLYNGVIPPGLAGNGTATISGGGFVAPEVNPVTLTAGIPATPTGSLMGWAGVKASIGMFRVKVLAPGIPKPVTGSGIYLPKSNSAWGYFPGTTLGGRVELTVP